MSDTIDKFVTPVLEAWGVSPVEHRGCPGVRGINLIAATTTRTGLEVYAQLDERPYPKAITNQQIAAVTVEGDAFHPGGNCLIKPRT